MSGGVHVETYSVWMIVQHVLNKQFIFITSWWCKNQPINTRDTSCFLFFGYFVEHLRYHQDIDHGKYGMYCMWRHGTSFTFYRNEFHLPILCVCSNFSETFVLLLHLKCQPSSRSCESNKEPYSVHLTKKKMRIKNGFTTKTARAAIRRSHAKSETHQWFQFEETVHNLLRPRTYSVFHFYLAWFLQKYLLLTNCTLVYNKPSVWKCSRNKVSDIVIAIHSYNCIDYSRWAYISSAYL